MGWAMQDPRPMRRVFLAICGFVLLAPAAFAHAGTDERIADATREIAAEPARADLYIKRGELHRLHRDWPAALADFEKAARLDPSLDRVLLSRGRLGFESGDYERARGDLSRYIEKHPDDRGARLVRARLLSKLRDWPAAVGEYDRLIELLPHPAPEYFIERAGAQAAQGGSHVPAALEGLDSGIEKLGPVLTLQEQAIELEVRLGNWDGALSRLDTLARWLAPERLWRRRGEILARAGRSREATEAFRRSLEVVARMPPRRRNAPAMQQFEREIRAELADGRRRASTNQ